MYNSRFDRRRSTRLSFRRPAERSQTAASNRSATTAALTTDDECESDSSLSPPSFCRIETLQSLAQNAVLRHLHTVAVQLEARYGDASVRVSRQISGVQGDVRPLIWQRKLWGSARQQMRSPAYFVAAVDRVRSHVVRHCNTTVVEELRCAALAIYNKFVNRRRMSVETTVLAILTNHRTRTVALPDKYGCRSTVLDMVTSIAGRLAIPPYDYVWSSKRNAVLCDSLRIAGSNLTHLQLAVVGDALLSAIGTHCPNVVDLDISIGLDATDDGLLAIAGLSRVPSDQQCDQGLLCRATTAGLISQVRASPHRFVDVDKATKLREADGKGQPPDADIFIKDGLLFMPRMTTLRRRRSRRNANAHGFQDEDHFSEEDEDTHVVGPRDWVMARKFVSLNGGRGRTAGEGAVIVLGTDRIRLFGTDFGCRRIRRLKIHGQFTYSLAERRHMYSRVNAVLRTATSTSAVAAAAVASSSSVSALTSPTVSLLRRLDAQLQCVTSLVDGVSLSTSSSSVPGKKSKDGCTSLAVDVTTCDSDRAADLTVEELEKYPDVPTLKLGLYGLLLRLSSQLEDCNFTGFSIAVPRLEHLAYIGAVAAAKGKSLRDLRAAPPLFPSGFRFDHLRTLSLDTSLSLTAGELSAICRLCPNVTEMNNINASAMPWIDTREPIAPVTSSPSVLSTDLCRAMSSVVGVSSLRTLSGQMRLDCLLEGMLNVSARYPLSTAGHNMGVSLTSLSLTSSIVCNAVDILILRRSTPVLKHASFRFTVGDGTDLRSAVFTDGPPHRCPLFSETGNASADERRQHLLEDHRLLRALRCEIDTAIARFAPAIEVAEEDIVATAWARPVSRCHMASQTWLMSRVAADLFDKDVCRLLHSPPYRWDSVESVDVRGDLPTPLLQLLIGGVPNLTELTVCVHARHNNYTGELIPLSGAPLVSDAWLDAVLHVLTPPSPARKRSKDAATNHNSVGTVAGCLPRLAVVTLRASADLCIEEAGHLTESALARLMVRCSPTALRQVKGEFSRISKQRLAQLTKFYRETMHFTSLAEIANAVALRKFEDTSQNPPENESQQNDHFFPMSSRLLASHRRSTASRVAAATAAAEGRSQSRQARGRELRHYNRFMGITDTAARQRPTRRFHGYVFRVPRPRDASGNSDSSS